MSEDLKIEAGARRSVSIVICTYNRAKLLGRLLLALSRQTIAPEQLEIVVVDDGSEDETHMVSERMRSSLANLKYISPGRNIGLAGAANLGIQSSQGNYILFTDDDCIPREDWAEQVCAALDRHPIIAGAIASPDRDFIKLCHNVSEFHPFLPGRKARSVKFIAGANMGFRRSAIEELRGFLTEREYSPDMELILRARQKGYKVHFTPQAVVLHDPARTTLKSILRYSADHASATIILRNKYRSVMRTPFVLRRPAFILAASPIIALRVTGEIYLRNLRLIRHFWTAPVVYALKLAWCWGAARGLRAWIRAGREP